MRFLLLGQQAALYPGVVGFIPAHASSKLVQE
jgi:hypothetical protein